jgi:hypothetical protein
VNGWKLLQFRDLLLQVRSKTAVNRSGQTDMYSQPMPVKPILSTDPVNRSAAPDDDQPHVVHLDRVVVELAGDGAAVEAPVDVQPDALEWDT